MFLPIVAVVGLIVGADVGDIVGLTKLFVVETEEESVGEIVIELTGTIVDGILERHDKRELLKRKLEEAKKKREESKKKDISDTDEYENPFDWLSDYDT